MPTPQQSAAILVANAKANPGTCQVISHRSQSRCEAIAEAVKKTLADSGLQYKLESGPSKSAPYYYVELTILVRRAEQG